MKTKKAWLRANGTYVVVGVLWLITFVITGLVYYSCVFGKSSGKIIANAENTETNSGNDSNHEKVEDATYEEK